MDSDVSLHQFVSPFPDLPTSEGRDSQTVSIVIDSEDGVVYDMRR